VKLKVFQSEKGDCFLLTTNDGKNILCDGGMRTSYTEHVAPTMGEMRSGGEKLNLIYVSHIDRDHVYGILQLLEDLVAWRIYEYQQETGLKPKKPTCTRPPEVDAIWHNAFNELAGEKSGDVEDMLATTASVLESSASAEGLEKAIAYRELATSVGDAIELSRRIRADQLGIPLNEAFGGNLALARSSSKPVKVGALEMTLLGPTAEDLEALRAEWNGWLAENQRELSRIRAKMEADADRLTAEIGEVPALKEAIIAQGDELVRSAVTLPNLASLMFLAREGEKTILLTGDGISTDIVNDLERTKLMKPRAGLHVDVLKIQHHGSEKNLDETFAERVTADHYVFCGNGEHHNPDLSVVQLLLNARLSGEDAAVANGAADREIAFWFNSSSEATEDEDNKKHMAELEKLMGEAVQVSDGRLRSFFLNDHFFELEI
jgi:beta-lactamase superfamily II metal-dependent hydrolase